MKSKRLILCLLISLLGLQACSTNSVTVPVATYQVEVDSMGVAADDKKTFVLLPVNKGVTADDLQFKEYAAYVSHALVEEDFAPASSSDIPQIAVLIGYGMDKALDQTYEFSLPATNEKLVYSPEFTTTTVANPVNINSSRFMLLGAVDLTATANAKKAVKLWEVFSTSNGMTNDLRNVFPVLATASIDHLGKNNGGRIKVAVTEDDDKLAAVKGKQLLPVSNDDLNNLPEGTSLVVTMKNGTILRGKFMDFLFTTLWIDTAEGQKKLEMSDVKGVQKREK